MYVYIFWGDTKSLRKRSRITLFGYKISDIKCIKEEIFDFSIIFLNTVPQLAGGGTERHPVKEPKYYFLGVHF